MRRILPLLFLLAGCAVYHPPQVADGDCERYRPLVAQYNWPVDRMMRVISLETIGCTDFHNERSGDYGIFQVHWRWAGDGPWGMCGDIAPSRWDLMVPAINVECANRIYGLQGGGAWMTWEASG
jgi:hypothetical protein